MRYSLIKKMKITKSKEPEIIPKSIFFALLFTSLFVAHPNTLSSILKSDFELCYTISILH